MRALHRAGRQGDALHACQRARSRLVAELGVDPGSELQRLEAAILSGDAEFAPAVVIPSRGRTIRVSPRSPRPFRRR